jgi:hypothetical protein
VGSFRISDLRKNSLKKKGCKMKNKNIGYVPDQTTAGGESLSPEEKEEITKEVEKKWEEK